MIQNLQSQRTPGDRTVWLLSPTAFEGPSNLVKTSDCQHVSWMCSKITSTNISFSAVESYFLRLSSIFSHPAASVFFCQTSKVTSSLFVRCLRSCYFNPHTALCHSRNEENILCSRNLSSCFPLATLWLLAWFIFCSLDLLRLCLPGSCHLVPDLERCRVDPALECHSLGLTELRRRGKHWKT